MGERYDMQVTHCHNLYHAPQGGMMALLSYQT